MFYNQPDRYDAFNELILNFWQQYSSFLVKNKDCNELYLHQDANWDSRYVRCLLKAYSYWNTAAKSDWEELVKELLYTFKKLVRVFTADEQTFYMNTALYQVGPDSWKAIEKLPTEYSSITDEFYSFSIFGNETVSSGNPFVSHFRDLFRTSEKYDIMALYQVIEQYNDQMLYAYHSEP